MPTEQVLGLTDVHISNAVVWPYSQGDVASTHSREENITNQSTDTIKAHLGEPMSVILGVCTYRRIDEGLLTGAEMTQTFASPKAHPSMSEANKSWKPASYCTA